MFKSSRSQKYNYGLENEHNRSLLKLSLSLYVCTHVPVLLLYYYMLWKRGKHFSLPLEDKPSHCLPPLPPHLGSYTHQTQSKLAENALGLSGPEFVMFFQWKTQTGGKVGAERTAGQRGICDIMTGGGRPVKIRLHIWSLKLLLSFLEMSLKYKYYK